MGRDLVELSPGATGATGYVISRIILLHAQIHTHTPMVLYTCSNRVSKVKSMYVGE